MKSLKTKRIFVLIWVILALSFLSSISWLTPSISEYSKHPRIMWLALLKLINLGILIIISVKLWKIVDAYTNKNEWQANFYYKLRQIGYCAIALTLLGPAIESGIMFSDFLVLHTSISYVIVRLIVFDLTQSPLMWIFTFSIFLLAELLRVANEVKAENESII